MRTLIDDNLPKVLADRVAALLPAKIFKVPSKPGEFRLRVYIIEVRGHLSGEKLMILKLAFSGVGEGYIFCGQASEFQFCCVCYT